MGPEGAPSPLYAWFNTHALVLAAGLIGLAFIESVVRALRGKPVPNRTVALNLGMWLVELVLRTGTGALRFGAFVLHSLAEHGLLDKGLRIRTLTLPDVFQDHDTPEKMYEFAGLDARSIAASAIKALGRGDERALKLIVG